MTLLSKKIYFASDLHLGVPTYEQSRERENRFIRWLDMIEPDLGELYLVGDVFDFWFDYDYAVPKGFVRLLGRLAAISDSGVPIYYFKGNHDMWVRGYFTQELGAQIFTDPIEREYGGKRFYIGHGDGLGPGDYGYKFIKKVFAFPPFKWLYRWLHPDIGIRMAQFWSKTSRYSQNEAKEEKFLGEENEWLAVYCREVLQKQHFDYFIFGHRHLPLEIKLNENSTYINLGDWIRYNTYAVFDGEQLLLKEFDDPAAAGNAQ